jgi:hypothetical protein
VFTGTIWRIFERMLKYILRFLAPFLLKKLGSAALSGSGPMGVSVQTKAAEIIGVVAAATGVASLLLSWIPLLNLVIIIPALIGMAAGGYALYIGRRLIWKRLPAIGGIIASLLSLFIMFYTNGWLVDKMF